MCNDQGMSIANDDLRQRLSFGLGDRLAKALEVGGVSVQDMAENLDASRTTISNYLHGRTRMPRAAKIAWALRTGVPLEWIETGVLPTTFDGPEGEVIDWYFANPGNEIAVLSQWREPAEPDLQVVA